jgi:hypothetical protein
MSNKTYVLNAREGDVVDVPGAWVFVLRCDDRGDYAMVRVPRQDAPITQSRKEA